MATPATSTEKRRGAGADEMAHGIVIGALLVEFTVLAVTGVALFFLYRPSAAQALNGLDAPTDNVVTVLRTIHGATSSLTVLTAVAAVVVFVATGTHGRITTSAISGSLVVAVAAASFTGYLLPWDQLALWAVTVGENLSGYRPMFDERVRFVLIGGTEVGTDTVLRWLGVHSMVLTPLAMVLAMVLWRRRSAARQLT